MKKLFSPPVLDLLLAHFLLYAVYLFHAPNVLPGGIIYCIYVLGILSLNLFLLGNMVNSDVIPYSG